MRSLRHALGSSLAILFLLAAPHVLGAQVRPEARPEARPEVRPEARDTTPPVPKEMMPPPGKCRIWISGVPPKQQPAPTECSVALRQNPTNGIVLYGPAPKDDDDARFDLKFGLETSARPAALRSTSTSPRRDSVKPEPAKKDSVRKPERP